MQPSDRVYYTHTYKHGLQQKFPAIVLSADETSVEIRIGRLNVTTQKIEVAEYSVSPDSLSKRNSPCNYEDELLGND